jgi:hypothetical protein
VIQLCAFPTAHNPLFKRTCVTCNVKVSHRGHVCHVNVSQMRLVEVAAVFIFCLRTKFPVSTSSWNSPLVIPVKPKGKYLFCEVVMLLQVQQNYCTSRSRILLRHVLEHQRKRPLGRPRRRWEDGIKMDLREIGWGGGGVDLPGSG